MATISCKFIVISVFGDFFLPTVVILCSIHTQTRIFLSQRKYVSAFNSLVVNRRKEKKLSMESWNEVLIFTSNQMMFHAIWKHELVYLSEDYRWQSPRFIQFCSILKVYVCLFILSCTWNPLVDFVDANFLE